MGLTRGVFHVEAKYTSRGPRLIEFNARLGGGQVYETNLRATGIIHTYLPQKYIHARTRIIISQNTQRSNSASGKSAKKSTELCQQNHEKQMRSSLSFTHKPFSEYSLEVLWWPQYFILKLSAEYVAKLKKSLRCSERASCVKGSYQAPWQRRIFTPFPQMLGILWHDFLPHNTPIQRQLETLVLVSG